MRGGEVTTGALATTQSEVEENIGGDQHRVGHNAMGHHLDPGVDAGGIGAVLLQVDAIVSGLIQVKDPKEGHVLH